MILHIVINEHYNYIRVYLTYVYQKFKEMGQKRLNAILTLLSISWYVVGPIKTG